MNFTAIDFETANSARTSICAIGIAVVENGKIVQSISQLVRPVPDFYSYWNTAVHGITSDMTNKQPYFMEIWEDMKPYIENRKLVAHNAPFDVGVLRSILTAHNSVFPKTDYYCSCSISKKIFKQLDNHKLSTVCKHLNIKLNHHEAESDAIGSATIILKVAQALGIDTMDGLISELKVKPKWV
ncbi:MAG: 3'-5' exonuclease [Cytophagales bacterium]|nr:3'-5' exonuclease [Cytophaga sp.]